MSKYLDALRTARPEQLYVFDLTDTDLSGGTVSSQGYTGGSITVEEDVGFAEIDSVEPIIDGVSRAVHPNVIHDRSVNNADQYFSSFLASGGSSSFVGPNADTKWGVEMVFKPGAYNRGRNSSFCPLLAFEQTNVTGLALDFDFTNVYEPTFQFVYTQDFDESLNTELIRTTATYAPGNVYHVALLKTDRYYALYVNGTFAGSGQALETYNSTAPTSLNYRLGGWSSLNHADSILQSFAVFDRYVTPEEISNRYSDIDITSEYLQQVSEFIPEVNIFLEEGKGTLEPFIHSLSSGSSSVDFYEDENGHIRIQPSELAAPVTKEKILKFDISDFDVAPSTFLDIVAVTGANSSVTVEYSFDNTTYSTFTEGLDTIAELDKNWGGVV